MTAVVIANTAQADTIEVPVPAKSTGEPYIYEMLFNGYADRAYADTPAELLGCLINGYEAMNDTERLTARLRHATRTQATAQADFNWHHNNLVGEPDEVISILTSSRSTPPAITEWSSEVPIVIVDVFYEPFGALPQPTSTISDVKNPPNIVWLRVHDETEYLTSLARADHIALHQHADFA